METKASWLFNTEKRLKMKKVRKNSKYFILLATLTMVTACQTAQSPTPVVYSPPSDSTLKPEQIIKATPEEVLETTSNIPDWCNILPTEIDHVYACGEAKSGSLNMARKRAVLDAKRQMADIINGRISSVMREFVTKTDIENDQSSLSRIEIITTNTIEEVGLWGYEQIGSETQPEGNQFRHYVLVRFPIGMASMQLLSKIRSDDELVGQAKAIKTLNQLEKQYKVN